MHICFTQCYSIEDFLPVSLLPSVITWQKRSIRYRQRRWVLTFFSLVETSSSVFSGGASWELEEVLVWRMSSAVEAYGWQEAEPSGAQLTSAHIDSIRPPPSAFDTSWQRRPLCLNISRGDVSCAVTQCKWGGRSVSQQVRNQAPLSSSLNSFIYFYLLHYFFQ